MFYRRGQETADGLVNEAPMRNKGESMSLDFPFSEYLSKEDLEALKQGTEEINLSSQEIAREIDDISIDKKKTAPVEPDAWPMNPSGIKQPQPIPPELPSRINVPPGQAMPYPTPPIPKVDAKTVQIPPMPKGRLPTIPPIVMPKSKPEAKKEDKTGTDTSLLRDMQKSMGEFVEALEGINTDILGRVNMLEEAMANRSRELKEEAKGAFDEVIDRARKIKDVMHEAELKNLEIQEKTMELLNKQEDRVVDRAEKFKFIYPTY